MAMSFAVSANIEGPSRIGAEILLLMIAAALAFLYHGNAILFGAVAGPGRCQFAASHHWPAATAFLVGLVQVAGGMSILSGVLFRLGLTSAFGVMIGAIFLIHIQHRFDVSNGGVESALTQLLVASALLLTGPGAYSGAVAPAFDAAILNF